MKKFITIILMIASLFCFSMGLTACSNSSQNRVDNTIVKVQSISLNKTTLTLVEGESDSLTATISPKNATNKTITWSSSNSNVATINNGLVKAIGVGLATITASTTNGKTASCEVIVSARIINVESISLNKTTLSLLQGESDLLTATITPNNATDKTITWATSDPNVATVENGLVTAMGVGSATITATTTNGKTASCEVIVSAKIINVESISLNKTTLSLVEGESDSLTATITPNNATDKTITWSSSNSNVATVENGLVTAIGVGSATITATTTNGKTASCEVIVSARIINVESISLNKTTLSLLEGESDSLTATISPSNATNKTITWSSSNSNVATINNGLVTAIGVGSATITATTTNGKTASCEVSITAKAVENSAYVRDGDYIYFGEYPQTIKASNVTITQTTDSRGYYLGSDGQYYAKVVVETFEFHIFSNNMFIEYGATYYFKVEPIKWRILTEDSTGRALLLCESVIENQSFDADNSNNYAQSDIRAFLNGAFYNKAFNSLQKQLIQTTLIDNSSRSTNPEDNPLYWNNGANANVCEDTQDNVFLPSLQQITTSAYGFNTSVTSSDMARMFLPSDYIKAEGIVVMQGGDAYGYPQWWLRSPFYESASENAFGPSNVRIVNNDGRLTYCQQANKSDIGVVPALYINLGASGEDTDVQVQNITLNKTTSNIIVGYTDTLTALISPIEATDKAVTWSSSNPSVATVSNGVITALGAGTTTITASSSNGLSANCVVTVVANPSTITTYQKEGNYIYFGEYPQTIKASNVTVTQTTDSRGYYLGSDGQYYAKVVADPYSNKIAFSNTDSVVEGVTYYFKVQPIRWRILTADNSGKTLLMCDSIIANMEIDSKGTNSYAKSDIRAWLNNQFYSTAFTSLQKQMIQTTLVDNSAKSTNPYGNPNTFNNGVNTNACEDTLDNIFLLSYEEITNTSLGFDLALDFNRDEAKQLITTDYSRATGAFMNIGETTGYYGNGNWWTRSPYYTENFWDVTHAGSKGGGGNSMGKALGVVPALWVQL